MGCLREMDACAGARQYTRKWGGGRRGGLCLDVTLEGKVDPCFEELEECVENPQVLEQRSGMTARTIWRTIWGQIESLG